MLRHRKHVDKNSGPGPFIKSLLDSTKCYPHQETFNVPRSVAEKFRTKAVEKLSKTSLKNPRLKKEYNVLKDLIEKSTYVSSTKVLVKKGTL